jgi:hypothetical protein
MTFFRIYRAPARSLVADPSALKNETSLWESLAMNQGQFDQLGHSFPILNHPLNPTMTKDSLSRPFGCITQKGLSHLRDTGSQLISKLISPCADGFQVRVFATNYQRTQVTHSVLMVHLYNRQCSQSFDIFILYEGECSNASFRLTSYSFWL